MATSPGSIMMSDLSRMAREAPTHTVSTLNRAGYAEALADFEDRERNRGQTSAQISAEWAKRLDEEREADLVRPFVEGSPPGGYSLTAWHAWKISLEDERDHELSVRDRLLNHAAAVTTTQRSLAEAVTAGAKAMLAGMGFGSGETEPQTPAVNPEQISRQLEVEKLAAAQATEALKIVDAKIAVTEKQLAAVSARANEFVNPELVNIAGALGPRYIRAIAEVAEVSSLLFALGIELGDGGRFGSGFESFERMTFPRPGTDTTRLCPPEKFVIGRPSDADRVFWRNAKNTLLASPHSKISLPIK
jgi:hypothetical protein